MRFFVGTVSQISEGVAGAWSNVSRGLGYSVGGNRWRFAQFGNDSVAANKSCVLQRSTGASFADLVAPKASFCETVAGFVILADCNDAGTGLATGFGDQSDRWWCCGINDVTTWTPSLATQCASGRLVDALVRCAVCAAWAPTSPRTRTSPSSWAPTSGLSPACGAST